MELPFRELQYTLDQAKAYVDGQEKHPELLRSYCSDLVEDISSLEKCRSSYGEKANECQQLIAEAKRLKRDAEKLAYSLEIARKQAPQLPQPASGNDSTKSFAGAKLPKIVLPIFDGETADDYRGFIEAFNETISVEPNLSAVRKWLLLKAQLSGRALELVAELPISPETFDSAIHILNKAYGSARRAVMKLYQRIQALPNAQADTESLRLTNAKIEGILLSLAGLKVNPNADDFLRAVVLSKYPHDIMHTLKVTDDTTLEQFRADVSEYIQLRTCTLHEITATSKVHAAHVDTNGNNGSKGGASGSKEKPRHIKSGLSSNGGDTQKSAPPAQVKSSTSTNNKKPRTRLHKCVFCSGDHWSDECEAVKALDDRRKKVADCCQKCLREAHPNVDCEKWSQCFYCKENTHNRAICPKTFGANGKILFITSQPSQKAECEKTKFITVKLPASNVAKTNKATPRALLDTAGGRSLITSDLAEQLQLTTASNRRIRLTGLNDAPVSNSSGSRKLLLYPLKGKPIEIEVFVVPDIVDDITSTNVAELRRQYPKYSNLPMPNEGNGERIQLLIGYSNLTKMVTLQKSIRINQQLQLMGTHFGWVPFGNLPEETESIDQQQTPMCVFKNIDPVKLMSDLELIGLTDFTKSQADEEIIALQQFHKTIERIGNQYQIEWPYRYDPPDLQENFGVAYGRLVSLYKQFHASPELLEAYDQIIREQVENDIVETINTRKSSKNTRVHYLPHRAVVRFGKSTPVRMVFDASSKAGKNARSLNDNILKGGNWVNEIPGILLRFRKHSIAVTSDIEKAFHQILIAPKDRDVVRFLWLRNIHKPPSPENLITYRFKRMAFGVVASPYLLTATIKHHFRQTPTEFSARIEQDLYADNLVSSLPSTMDAEQFYRSTKASFAEMGMNITKWATDDPQLRLKFSEADRIADPQQIVLGIHWNTLERRIRINQANIPTDNKITKRKTLQETARVFDPLGWVSPVILKAKLFIRKIWLKQYTWDEELPPDLTQEWNLLRNNLREIPKVNLPRAYAETGIEEARRIELHAFCDASAMAYGVAVYICVHHRETSWTGIIASKTRLAPKKELSIPRLELLAAVTAAKYLSYVHRELKIEDSYKYLWGDSKCVISWVSSKKILPAIVEKAARSIQETGIEKFLYVPTDKNPADAASRGATIAELASIQWWSGPKWLQNAQEWPQQMHPPSEADPELNLAKEIQNEEKILLTQTGVKLRKTIDPQSNENSPFNMNPSDFSSFGQLIRRTAYCLKAAARFTKTRGILQLSADLDHQHARILWLYWDQRRIYQPAETIKSNVSYLRNLKITIDEDRLIRCKTRLNWAKLQRDEVEPILLAKRTKLTKLIILSIHTNNFHAGTAHTLAVLRKRYWLPHGRREIYKILRENCFTCRRQNAQPFKSPEMAQLPEFRITKSERPFANVGVDVFGPYKIKQKLDEESKIVKYWVIIFTCLIIRATHLELLKNMTAEEFLKTFRRFTSRRGVPKLIVSDNAPQFTVVEGIFQCLWRRFATAEITSKYYAEHQVQWKFIPANAPWMGGAYERMIKTVKNTFDRVYGNKILELDQFELAMLEVEAVVNSRPITYIDKGIDTEIISPNDFLSVKYPSVPLDFNRAYTKNNLTETWREAEKYLNEFWRIWSEHYLREIRERRERMPDPQKSNAHIPQPGELVLMIDPDQKRSSWRVAVVERVIPGTDGKIRAVQIRAANRARMIRPVIKLASLKLIMDLPEDLPPLNADHNAIVIHEEEGQVELTQ